MRVRPVTAIARFALTVSIFSGYAAAAELCDRACLEGFVNQYLAAVVAHDPSRLPLTKNVRYTENGVALKLGDGMWGVAEALGTYKLYFADPKGGQVGFMGVVIEHGHPQIVALRLKVENRMISEVEAIIARSAGGPTSKPPAALVDKPIFHEALAPSERRPREELIKIANSYFEALVQAKGGIAPFDPNCTRVENGNITANNPAGSPMMKLTCGQQIEQEFSKFFTRIRDRRFPVVDEERGLVYTVIFFDHDGRTTAVKLKEGSVLGQTLTVSAPFDTPYSFMIGELFKIKDGKIHQVEAVLLNVPYNTPSAWIQR